MSRTSRGSRVPVPNYTTVPTNSNSLPRRQTSSRAFTPPVGISPSPPRTSRRPSNQFSQPPPPPPSNYGQETTRGVAQGSLGGGYGPYARQQNSAPGTSSNYHDYSDDEDVETDELQPTRPSTATVPAYEWDTKDLDDELHTFEPGSKLDRHGFFCCSLRGFLNLGTIFIIVVGLVTLFAGYPIALFYTRNKPKSLGFNLGGVNGTGQVPKLAGLQGLIDPTTPQEAFTKTGFTDGIKYNLVFSDEFSQDGRSFYPGDDPYWEAVDLNYWPTGDLEWYDPAAVSTQDGKLVIEMDETLNHNLNFRSGMLQSWNKFCLTTGIVEVSVSLPGDSRTTGFWPGAWMMGNLGRAGYGASTQGTWPYSYDSCDLGTFPGQLNAQGNGPQAALTSGLGGAALSSQPGQKLSACTCPGMDHPGPTTSTGRAAPEIDLIEAQIDVAAGVGQASQSYQMAPYTAGYEFHNTTPSINNLTLTQFNSYKGGPFQQAISGLSEIPTNAYNGTNYQTFGIEWWSDPNNRQDGYITWYQGNTATWTLTADDIGPDSASQVSARLISEEPMYLIINFAMSPSFQAQDWKNLKFPAKLFVDYVRIYQRDGVSNVGCDPPERPTSTYIQNHLNAYMDPNLTTWSQAVALYKESYCLTWPIGLWVVTSLCHGEAAATGLPGNKECLTRISGRFGVSSTREYPSFNLSECFVYQMSFLYSREDVNHIKQLHGLEEIQPSDEPVLDQKQPPRWKRPPEKIETPSNNRNRPSHNPFTHKTYDNLRESRASASSSQSLFQSGPSGSRSNPNSRTVVPSKHFPPSSSSSIVNMHATSNNGMGFIRHDTRPAKKRKTDSGSVVTSQTLMEDDVNFGNSDSWKTGTTHISPMSSSKYSPHVIDLADESATENNTLPPHSISILSSPLTPTESSDDIALRPNKPHTSYSPPVTEGIRNSLRSKPSKDRMTSRKPSTSTDHNSFENPKTALPDTPYTQSLTKRYQPDEIQDADGFDKVTLRDDSRKNWGSKSSGNSQIPKGLVRNSVEHIEALSSRRKDNPPFIDLRKMKGKGIVNSMKAKSLEGLTAANVPKPPPKANSAISTTNFTKSEHPKAKHKCVPLVEYLYKGELVKTTDGCPYSACFSKDGISIFCKVDSDSPVLKLPFSGSLQCPRKPSDLKSEPIVIFRFGSSGNIDADSLGLKFHIPDTTSSARLTSLHNLVQEFVQGPKEFVSKGAVSGIWTRILELKQYQTDDIINDSSVSTSSSAIKPKPQIIQRTTRGAAARNSSIMGTSSGNMDHVRRSPSPSSEELILVYPPSGTGALNITYGDMKRLEPGEFLNDTLIEFGLKSWLSEFRDRDSELADQVHVFSSFFYTQLRQKNLEEGYQSVRKWTSRVDIFKKNYIIVPINEHLHWYLAIICYPGRILQHNAQPNLNDPSAVTRSKEQEAVQESIQQAEFVHPATPSSDSVLTAQEEKEVEMQTNANLFSDESTDLLPDTVPPSSIGSPGPSRSLTRSPTTPGSNELVLDISDTMDVDDPPEDITTEPTLSEVPHIFTFDSLGSRHVNVLKTLNSYLQMEAKDKKGLAVSVNAYTGQALVPTQPNSCDCGIYLLHFVEQFMSDPERYVNQILNKPPKKSWSIVKSEREQIWNADKVAGKREALKQKVDCLSTEWKQSRKPESKGKGKGKEQEEVQPSGPLTRSDDEDSDIQVLEITPAPSTNKSSKPSKQKAQRLR